MEDIKLQSQYFGSIPYWAALVQAKAFYLDHHDRFEKQSYRNRTYILGPNGLQALVVPVKGRNKKLPMKEVKISYAEPWLRVHLNSLQTAYRSAPFFEYLYPEIETILLKKTTHLWELNQEVFGFLGKRLKVQLHAIEPNEKMLDLSHDFHPKRLKHELAPYPQVFQEKMGFTPHAGILDLLMNHLLEAPDYLRKLTL